MEAKLSQMRANVEAKKISPLGFIRDLKDELRKINWTTKEELKFCTKIVVGATLFFGLGIYGVDLVIKGVLEAIGIATHFIFG